MIKRGRVKTGIFGLDTLLGSGLWSNSVNVVLGSAGTGKTVFALQYILEGLENDEKCVFVSFDMDIKDIEETAKSFGWDISKYINKKKLAVNKFFAENVSYINNDLLNFIQTEAENHENVRIVIDSFTPLISSLDYGMRNDVNWFFSRLKELGTSVITLEESLGGNMEKPFIEIPIFLGDTVIHLKNIGYGEAFNRTLRIIKHRRSWHAEGVFPYRILKGIGIFIEGTAIVKKMIRHINLKEILEELGYSISDVPDGALQRLNAFSEECVQCSDDEIKKIVQMVIECYSKYPKS
ncbi:MAG: circadian clock protein KaiC [Archaeoglobus sp.]|nr:MAG: circadian clock protein KaiC [Archaeoglobus sp.]